jgi:hypothetical protein
MNQADYAKRERDDPSRMHRIEGAVERRNEQGAGEIKTQRSQHTAFRSLTA